jgi:hypothetical protein
MKNNNLSIARRLRFKPDIARIARTWLIALMLTPPPSTIFAEDKPPETTMRTMLSESGGGASYVESGLHFLQRLSWDSVANAKAYEVIIEEKDKSGNWIERVSNIVPNTFIEVSLDSGEYRFGVLSINVLNMRSSYDEIQWQTFVIIPAIEKQLEPLNLKPEEEKQLAMSSKVSEFDFSLEYNPAIALYGLLNDFIGTKFFPVGIAGRIGIFPNAARNFYFGAEFSPFWRIIEAKTQSTTVTSDMVGAHLNLLFRCWLIERRFGLTAQAGGGISGLLNFEVDSETQKYTKTILMVSVGASVSVLYMFTDTIYAEAGINFLHLISAKDKPNPGYLLPFVGAGLKF